MHFAPLVAKRNMPVLAFSQHPVRPSDERGDGHNMTVLVHDLRRSKYYSRICGAKYQIRMCEESGLCDVCIPEALHTVGAVARGGQATVTCIQGPEN